MTDTWNAAAEDFFRLAYAGKLEDAEAMVEMHPLARRSIHYAAARGRPDAVRRLLADQPELANARIGSDWSPLLLLSMSPYGQVDKRHVEGIVEAARQLLAHGADLGVGLDDDELPGRRFTVLAGAAGIVGSPALCEVLLEAGAEPNDGAALFLAASAESWGCADRILVRGGDWNATDSEERHAPLHWLLDLRYTRRAVEGLLDRGADPNVRVGPIRETALHVAARRRRKEILEPLHNAGVDLDAQTTAGVTAYRHALRRDFGELARALEKLGADTSTTANDELVMALHRGEIDRARELIAADRSVLVTRGPEEARMLPDLAAHGALEAVTLLLDEGMDIASPGLDDGTALHQAAWFGVPDMARLLIERGAPLDVRGDAHDSTPLGWVAHGSRYSGDAEKRHEAYERIAQMLLEAGAPLPGEGDRHDRPQLAEASEGVKRLLREYGWKG